MSNKNLKWIYLLILSLVWGSSYILIKKSLIGLTPLQVGSLRTILSTLLLLIIGYSSIKTIPKNKWKWIAITGYVSFIPPFLFAYAQTEIDSALAAILNSLTPLATLLIGIGFYRFKIDSKQISGVILGLIGSVLLMYQGSIINPDQNIVYVIFIILASILYALQVNLLKVYLQDVSAVAITVGNFIFIFPFAVIIFFMTDYNELDLNDKDVSRLFEQNDWVSAPVVDDSKNLIGRITIDDVVDVIMEDADQNFLGMAGVAEDTFAPPGRAARSRVFWLSMNLLTAFIASMTINIFKDVLDQIVYLAILMPIVASMGGVAATQTLTIVLRGLTLEQINSSNLRWLFKRELAVSILNGFVLSILVGLVTFFWFDEILLALLISFALVINLISAVIAGVFVPLILRSLNQDPAIAGSVVVTTVTDVIGFLSFLGLATIFLI